MREEETAVVLGLFALEKVGLDSDRVEMEGLEVGWKVVEGIGSDDWIDVAKGTGSDAVEDGVKVLATFLLHLCPL